MEMITSGCPSVAEIRNVRLETDVGESLKIHGMVFFSVVFLICLNMCSYFEWILSLSLLFLNPILKVLSLLSCLDIVLIISSITFSLTFF